MIEVKELEWEAEPTAAERPYVWTARPAFGYQYTVREVKGQFSYYFGPYFEGRTDTLEAARAACQADFSRRVLACVTVSEADIRADERERLAKLFEAGLVAEGNSIQGDIPAVIRSQTPPAGGG